MSSVADAPWLSERSVIGAYEPKRRPPQSFDYSDPVHRPYQALYEFITGRWSRPVTGQWLTPVVERLVELTRLPRNWDSYDGVAVTSAEANQALWFLTRFLEPESSAPWVVPLSDGGVQLEWHRDGLDIEIVLSPDESEFSIEDRVRNITWEGPPEDALRDPTREMLRPALTALRVG